VKRTLATAGLLASLTLVTAACGSSDTAATGSAPGASSSRSMSSMPSTSSSSPAASAAASGPVGPGCAAYAAQVPAGAGSVSGMATAPVATAAGNNPLLKTLTAAVSGQLNPQVDLVDTLNGGQFTVFAPVDDAFAKVDPAVLATLKTDSALLTKVLTYHVVPGQLSPSQVVGVHATAEGGSLDVEGTPEALTVNGAHVICGGVKTANATVYLIDGVLTPPAS
jgi:uncharacterized surface protein with fasciclin (FAS1) repeats